MKKVSIAMATYNGAKYLNEQLISILSQTYPIFEINIVDDCSTDDTRNILKDYQKKYPIIKVYFNDFNVGVAKTFEKAISLCTGDYIALSDQDDYWELEKINVLVSKIGNNSLIHSNARIVDEKLNVISETFIKDSRSYKYERWFDYVMQNNVTGCTALFSADILKKILPFPKSIILHDSYIAMHAFLLNGICYTKIPLVLYRQHGNNVHGANNVITYDKFSKVAKKKYFFVNELKQNLDQNYHETLDIISKYYYCIYSVSIPPIKVMIWTYRNLSKKNFFGTVLLTFFTKKIANYFYNKYC